MQEQKPGYRFAFIVVTALFFMWGFITVLNDILIPHLKEVFSLNYAQSMLVQFCFFGAYFVISVIYFALSIISGDPIQRIGYKNGILLALVIAGAGCSMFFVAAEIRAYWCFLLALFILASGITILQIAANPYVAILGEARTASSRLNLSQAFNSLGTTLAPLVGGYLIFTNTASGADAVKIPYLGLAAGFWLLAVVIKLTPLPSFTSPETIERNAAALRFPHLRYGMLAIFMYVGGEVALGSVIINYLSLPETAGLKKEMADHYLSYYWGGAMIGRFMGAIALNGMKNKLQQYGLMLGLGLLSFALIFFLIWRTGGPALGEVWPYGVFIVINFAGLIIARGKPALALALFSLVVIALVFASAFMNGFSAVWTLLAVGLFNSIMWSNIFTLSIAGLGKYSSQGSSLLVMMIVGGALVPLAVGSLADMEAVGLHKSILLAVICYAYLFFFGIYGYRAGKKGEEPAEEKNQRTISH
ncbi:MAG: MFS transporter, FHS family, L-fucose permease [Bacteroidetes bacterium]|nr:MAG: MFS transporter, FHS family, L-fucose permease [Bacteroidota bacterium]